MTAFRKRADGLLTGAQMRQARKALGLTQAQAAKLFGGGQVAFSRYENDDITQSEAMDSLVRVCLAQPANLTLLADQKGVSAIFTTDDNWANALVRRHILGIKSALEHQIAPDRVAEPSPQDPLKRHAKVIDIQRWRKAAA